MPRRAPSTRDKGRQMTRMGVEVADRDPDLAALDPAALRKAMGRFATGVTVVTTRAPNGKLEGLTVNSFATVSLDPPLVLWNLARRAGSFQAFASASHFAVNVLARDQLHLCRHFAAPNLDKLAHVPHRLGLGGCPLIEDTLAQFECAKATEFDGGDHVIFVGRVLRTTHREGDPLVFSGGDYHRLTALKT